MTRASKAPLVPGARYTFAMLTLDYVPNALDPTLMSIVIEPVQQALRGRLDGQSPPGTACCWSRLMTNPTPLFLNLPDAHGTAVALAGA